jgi:predicted N-acetyltransferase YhbS
MAAYEKDLGSGLILRSLRHEGDAARFIALNAAVTDEGRIAERLLFHHPETSYDDYFLVVDEQTGQAVSTTCLLPWRCAYEDVTLNVAMLEMVVTHPGYRHRGLVRIQIDHFHQIVDRRGFDLTIIQGIPYYYRQFGYAYALDHTPQVSLPAWRIPEEPADTSPTYHMRPAAPADSDDLAHLYELAMAGSRLYVQRSPAYWRYLLEHGPYSIRLIEDIQTGRAAGYLAISQSDGYLSIQETSLARYDLGLAILRQLKAEEAGEIRLVGSPANRLVRLANSLGCLPLPAYQWLWRIPDPARFLTKISPVLERRLASGGCAGLTAKCSLNLFRQAYALNFEAGKLAIEPLGFVDTSMGADGGDWCLPPEAFIRLSLGYRSLDQLQDAWPDILIKPASRYLLELLFPRLESAILMPY